MKLAKKNRETENSNTHDLNANFHALKQGINLIEESPELLKDLLPTIQLKLRQLEQQLYPNSGN